MLTSIDQKQIRKRNIRQKNTDKSHIQNKEFKSVKYFNYSTCETQFYAVIFEKPTSFASHTVYLFLLLFGVNAVRLECKIKGEISSKTNNIFSTQVQCYLFYFC